MNPLRGLAFDADAIARYTTSIEGPVLLGHSYGGTVISQAAPAVKDVAGLVFLSAFALDAGESCRWGPFRLPANVGLDHRVTGRWLGYRRPRQHRGRHRGRSPT
jgi:pimeloyl-ACP methyl ester carboxylesterase